MLAFLRLLYQIFINDLAENLGHASLGRLVTGVVIKSGFMGGLCTNVNDCHGIVSNRLVVEWETSRVYKFGIMVGFVLDSLGEDGCEGVNSVQLIVRDDHEKWEKFPGWQGGHRWMDSL